MDACSNFSSPPRAIALAPGPTYDAAVAITVLFPLGMAGFVWLFLANRKYSTRLRKRDPYLLVASAVGSLAFWACTVLYDVVGGEHYPCALLGLLMYMACPLLASPVLVKVLKYSAQVVMQKLRENDDIDLTPSAAPEFWRAHLKMVLFPRACSKHERIMSARFTRTASFFVLWLGVTTLPFLLAYAIKLALTPAWREGCFGCELDLADCIILICLNSMDCVIMLLTVGRHTRSKHDPLRILHECLLAILLPGTLCNVAVALYIADPAGAQAGGEINYRSLTLLAPIVCIYLQTVHQVYLSSRLKRQMLAMDHIEVEDRFQDVCVNKELRRQLQTYLYKELSGETLHFLDAVDAFRRAYSSSASPSSSPATVRAAIAPTTSTHGGGGIESDAVVIFHRFIEPNRAPEEVNLPHAIRVTLVQNVAAHNITAGMFDAAYTDIKNSLLKDGFARFLAKVNLEYSTEQASKAAVAASANGSRITGISLNGISLNGITPQSTRAGTQTNDFQLAPSGSSGGGSAHSPRSSALQV